MEWMSALYYRSLTKVIRNETAGIQGELIANWVKAEKRTQVGGKEIKRKMKIRKN